MSKLLEKIFQEQSSDDNTFRYYRLIEVTEEDSKLKCDQLNTGLSDDITTQTRSNPISFFGTKPSEFDIGDRMMDLEREDNAKDAYILDQNQIDAENDVYILEANQILGNCRREAIKMSQQIETLLVENETVDCNSQKKNVQLQLNSLFYWYKQPISSNETNYRGMLDPQLFISGQALMDQRLSHCEGSSLKILPNPYSQSSNNTSPVNHESIASKFQQKLRPQKSLSSQDTHQVYKNFIYRFKSFAHHKGIQSIVKRVLIRIPTIYHELNSQQQYIKSLRDLMEKLINSQGKSGSYKFETFAQLTVKQVISNQEIQSESQTDNLRVQIIKSDEKNQGRKRWTYKRDEYYEVTRRLMLWYLRRQYPVHIIRSGDMSKSSKARNLKYIRRWIQELTHPGVCTKIYMKDNIIQGLKQERPEMNSNDDEKNEDKELDKPKRGRKRKE